MSDPLDDLAQAVAAFNAEVDRLMGAVEALESAALCLALAVSITKARVENSYE